VEHSASRCPTSFNRGTLIDFAPTKFKEKKLDRDWLWLASQAMAR